MKNSIILVGTGPMAIEYQKVLAKLGVSFTAIGRGEHSADVFRTRTGVKALTGGLKKYLERYGSPDMAIVATGVEALSYNVHELLDAGCRSILVEKPAGLNLEEIALLNARVENLNAKVYVAYNRRFYSSVQKVIELISNDGGLTSMHFEFTELGWKIKDIDKAQGVKENWFLANSTHVIDLAFYIAGQPLEISTYKSGSTSWHPSGAQFTGAGRTSSECVFSYHANWDGPGRWSIELVTKNQRFILSPLEQIKVQDLGSFELRELPLESSLDLQFKPGLFRQVEAFLDGKFDARLCSIRHQASLIPLFRVISGYQ